MGILQEAKDNRIRGIRGEMLRVIHAGFDIGDKHYNCTNDDVNYYTSSLVVLQAGIVPTVPVARLFGGEWSDSEHNEEDLKSIALAATVLVFAARLKRQSIVDLINTKTTVKAAYGVKWDSV